MNFRVIQHHIFLPNMILRKVVQSTDFVGYLVRLQRIALPLNYRLLVFIAIPLRKPKQTRIYCAQYEKMTYPPYFILAGRTLYRCRVLDQHQYKKRESYYDFVMTSVLSPSSSLFRSQNLKFIADHFPWKLLPGWYTVSAKAAMTIIAPSRIIKDTC